MRRSSDPARGQGPTCELGDSRSPAAACRIEAGRACVVRHRYYPGDQRMENQIRALLAAGYEVDVFCLRQKGEPRMSVENGVRVFRTWAVPRKRAGFLRYIAEYLSFWLASLWFLTRRQITHRYDLILVLTLPDFLPFSAIFARILGARVLVDMREVMPEMAHADYGFSMDSLPVKLMIAAEQGAIRFADYALTCTEQMRETYVSRGADPDKIAVMLNVADPVLFSGPVLTDEQPGTDGAFCIVTHGTIKARYGHDVLIRAMPQVLEAVPGARLQIMGDGPLRAEYEALARDLGLAHAVEFAGFVPYDELLARLRAAHCGVVPLVSTPETERIHTFKMYEYMALGIPVVISRTWAVEATLDDEMVCFFTPGDPADLARALIRLHGDPALRRRLAARALAWYEQHGPEQQQAVFLRAVERTVGRGLQV